MKRDELKAKGLSDEQIDFVMAENGKDVEAHKSKLTAAQAEADGLKAQLTEANKQIEGFKALDIEGVKKAADDYKAKFEQAQADASAQLAQLKFDHALEQALSSAKAKNSKAVKALLDAGGLKLNEADGSILGLKEQLEKIRSENDYLFESDEPAPRIVAGGINKPVLTDPLIAAARRAAGLAE